MSPGLAGPPSTSQHSGGTVPDDAFGAIWARRSSPSSPFGASIHGWVYDGGVSSARRAAEGSTENLFAPQSTVPHWPALIQHSATNLASIYHHPCCQD
ncbi:hypothetical protein T492DRAFT_870702 [Pavlovales sp. CCMP2436]|nr:hypothetical protein T492DRAFT_870702 [Pavlovales sp. CCMP2436]